MPAASFSSPRPRSTASNNVRLVPDLQQPRRGRTLPATRVAETRGRVPGYRHNFIERFLNPDGTVVVAMNDQAERLAVVETIADRRVSGHARDAALNPRVSGQPFGLRQPKVLHDAQGLRVGAVLAMQESVGASVFVGIAKSQLVADRVVFQESERMAQPDIVVCPGLQARAIQVRAEHDEEVVGCSPFGFGWRRISWRRRLARCRAANKQQGDYQCWRA